MSAPVASVTAQAKVNLFLRILARESSGYHQIETLFCRLDLGDVVRVRPTAGARSLDCAGPAIPPEGLGPVEGNLAWRAASAFAQARGWPAGFEIQIDKRIPVGGGLGGGSADAGAVLRALNALAPAPLPAADLVAIAGTLGADVPFLTQDDSPLALAWGRGDRLLCLPPLPARRCLVVSAPFGVSTAAAYGWFADSGAPRPGAWVAQARTLTDWTDTDALSHNDFEAVVLERVPALRQAFDALRAGAHLGVQVARLSGSGSTLFGLLSPGGAHNGPQGLGLPDGFVPRLSLTSTAVSPVLLQDKLPVEP